MKLLKRMVRTKYFFTTLFLSIGISLYLFYPRPYTFSGNTFGTYYKIIVVAPKLALNAKKTDQRIQTILQELDGLYSTYRNDSALSIMNTAHHTNTITLHPDLHALFVRSKQYYTRMDGAWDPCLLPLTQALGFTNAPAKTKLPDMTAYLGFKHVRILANNQVKKAHPKVACDLSSVAKGTAVDTLTDTLNTWLVKGTYVDIGGEVRTTGAHASGRQWQIGVQSPVTMNALVGVVAANNLAMATSGNYLNKVTDSAGNTVGHILTPSNNGGAGEADPTLLSVSIQAETCELADAVATGVFAMGATKAKAWLTKNENVAALLVTQTKHGDIRVQPYNGFLRRVF